jgi:hypothetical protein
VNHILPPPPPHTSSSSFALKLKPPPNDTAVGGRKPVANSHVNNAHATSAKKEAVDELLRPVTPVNQQQQQQMSSTEKTTDPFSSSTAAFGNEWSSFPSSGSASMDPFAATSSKSVASTDPFAATSSKSVASTDPFAATSSKSVPSTDPFAPFGGSNGFGQSNVSNKPAPPSPVPAVTDPFTAFSSSTDPFASHSNIVHSGKKPQQLNFPANNMNTSSNDGFDAFADSPPVKPNFFSPAQQQALPFIATKPPPNFMQGNTTTGSSSFRPAPLGYGVPLPPPGVGGAAGGLRPNTKEKDPFADLMKFN